MHDSSYNRPSLEWEAKPPGNTACLQPHPATAQNTQLPLVMGLARHSQGVLRRLRRAMNFRSACKSVCCVLCVVCCVLCVVCCVLCVVCCVLCVACVVRGQQKMGFCEVNFGAKQVALQLLVWCVGCCYTQGFRGGVCSSLDQ